MDVPFYYEVIDDGIAMDYVPKLANSFPKPEELRMSQLGIADIPDVSEPNFDFDYTIPNFPETGSRPAAAAIPNAITEQPQMTREESQAIKRQHYLEAPTDEASPGREKKLYLHPQEQPTQSEPPAFEDFVDPTPGTPPKMATAKDNMVDVDEEDDDDDEEHKHEEIISFPRKPKRPKRPKRDQQDIPKVLVKGGKRQSTTSMITAEKPKQPPIKLTAAAAAESDIPKLLFEGLASLETDEVEQTLEILSQTFLLSPNKCTEAVDLGAHGICVLTMKKWQYHKRIQQLSCECIHNIVFNYKDGRIDLMEALAVMGALEIIIKSMDKFADSLGIQRFGLAALGNLLYGKGEALQARARKCVEEHDAITTVVSATRRFPKNAMVQGCGCIVLTGFFKLGDYKMKMAEAGTLLDIAAAVTNHPNNALIEKEASTFMKLFFGWSSGRSSKNP